MLAQILSKTPLWVWAIASALLALGLWQRRTRRVAPAALPALPLAMLALGLWTMAPGFAAQPLTAATWLLALGLAMQVGHRLPLAGGVRWLAAEKRLHVPGSWLPLALMMGIFSLRYASAVALTLQPAWRSALPIQLGLSLAFGALGGFFLGRTLKLLSAVPSRCSTMHGDVSIHA